ncbi:MAG: hypothetical protein WCG47_02875 [Dermatophilaceae bacterium]
MTPTERLGLAREQLARVPAAWIEPVDWSDLTMYAFYALENAVVAAADQTATDWQRSHQRKAALASQLHATNALPDVSTLLRNPNELRKAHAYGETTPPSSVTAESIEVLTEEYIEAVASLLGGKA